ncbi:ABC transporter substrate-binding protein [Cryobacterium sp. MLB-32]|uniref:ABC transporter substrate-binding protein n=1 Tax=Cryobacterium sp. MLB-32 TaxID=1529318 RepID=UPI0004E79ECB|nr:ABC transporter substrate-binding protein [Cryobacterium sp. MLB-32]KFF60127.1 ABC transporter substrate-binding protein [Cryobacterium sp. MLB-32]
MRARHALPALAAVAALLLTGCVDNSPASTGDAENGSAVNAPEVDAAAVALLPASVADSGTLVLGTSPNYPPNEFKNEAGDPIGWTIELGNAMAAKLGLTAEFTVARFETIIPGIDGGTIDVGASSFTDNVEREKQMDFVNYYEAGIQWASLTGNDIDPNNACGLKIAVQSTTCQDTVEIPAKSAACVAAGKPAIQKLPLDTQDTAATSVLLGQADAFSADSPVTLYAIEKLAGKLQTAGESSEVAPYGFAVAKDSGMAAAIQAALQSMVDDGSYAEILAGWGVQAGGIDTITINAAANG